jgi:urease accessory protein
MTSLLHLLHLNDPSLPIGSFSHSSGLETYVQEGIVFNKATAKEFAGQQLSQNIHFTDAALTSLAFDAGAKNDLATALDLDALCHASKLPSESRAASYKLGTRLLKIFEMEPSFILPAQFYKKIKTGEALGHYSIAFGLLANAMEATKEATLTAFYYNAATAFVINAVKLIPLGQQDGQEILLSLFPEIEALVQLNVCPDSNRIGYCCSGFDIRCMQHEQLYSRLYMS